MVFNMHEPRYTEKFKVLMLTETYMVGNALIDGANCHSPYRGYKWENSMLLEHAITEVWSGCQCWKCIYHTLETSLLSSCGSVGTAWRIHGDRTRDLQPPASLNKSASHNCIWRQTKRNIVTKSCSLRLNRRLPTLKICSHILLKTEKKIETYEIETWFDCFPQESKFPLGSLCLNLGPENFNQCLVRNSHFPTHTP